MGDSEINSICVIWEYSVHLEQFFMLIYLKQHVHPIQSRYNPQTVRFVGLKLQSQRLLEQSILYDFLHLRQQLTFPTENRVFGIRQLEYLPNSDKILCGISWPVCHSQGRVVQKESPSDLLSRALLFSRVQTPMLSLGKKRGKNLLKGCKHVVTSRTKSKLYKVIACAASTSAHFERICQVSGVQLYNPQDNEKRLVFFLNENSCPCFGEKSASGPSPVAEGDLLLHLQERKVQSSRETLMEKGGQRLAR